MTARVICRGCEGPLQVDMFVSDIAAVGHYECETVPLGIAKELCALEARENPTRRFTLGELAWCRDCGLIYNREVVQP